MQPGTVLSAVQAANRRLFLYNAPPAALWLMSMAAVLLGMPEQLMRRDMPWIGFVITMGALFLFFPAPVCFWNLWKFARRRHNPLRHPSVRALSSLGEPAAVAREIDADLERGPALFESPSTVVTPRWVFQRFKWGFNAGRLGDLLWVYPSSVETRSRSGMTLGTTCFATLAFRDGCKLSIAGTPKMDATDLVRAIALAAPWAEVGFNTDVKELWSSRFKELVARVDARKRQRGPS